MVASTWELRCALADPAAVLAAVREHGAAVRPAVFSAEQCARANEHAVAMVRHYDPQFDPADPATHAQAARQCGMKHGMLAQSYGAGNWQHAWDARQHEPAAEVHALFHGTDPRSTLTSVDAVSVGLVADNGKRWHHLDQRLSNPAECCLQSFATFNRAAPGAASLRILKGSHLLFEEFAAHKKAQMSEEEWKKTVKDDWYKLTDADFEWYRERGCEDVVVCAEAGDQVFWESRTVHCGYAGDDPAAPMRNVVYLCYRPRTDFTRLKQVLQARRDALNPEHADPAHPKHGKYLRNTNHWGTRLFPYTPWPGGREGVPRPPHPQLTEYGEIIAGLK